MSLAIDVDRVREVLLADGWHQVVNNSFEMDAYEYERSEERKPGGGDAGMRLGGGVEDLVPATGATWVERNAQGHARSVFCPITAILAVAYEWIDSTKKK